MRTEATPTFTTEHGGVAIEIDIPGGLVFTEAPPNFPELLGESVPEDWNISPLNDAAQDQFDDLEPENEDEFA